MGLSKGTHDRPPFVEHNSAWVIVLGLADSPWVDLSLGLSLDILFSGFSPFLSLHFFQTATLLGQNFLLLDGNPTPLLDALFFYWKWDPQVPSPDSKAFHLRSALWVLKVDIGQKKITECNPKIRVCLSCWFFSKKQPLVCLILCIVLFVSTWLISALCLIISCCLLLLVVICFHRRNIHFVSLFYRLLLVVFTSYICFLVAFLGLEPG